MKENQYEKRRIQVTRDLEIYRLSTVEGMRTSAIVKKTGVSKSTVLRSIVNFERENPQMAELMKRKGKDVTEEDYKRMQNEIASLKKELACERLRADIYEEMVSLGKEVYGIDLKKAGTK